MSFKVQELKEICGKQGLKKSGPKAKLIDRIIKHGSPKAKPSCTITPQYDKKVLQLAKLYLTDIAKQLKGKPIAYSLNIWEQVAEEYGIGGQLPAKAMQYAENKYKSIVSTC